MKEFVFNPNDPDIYYAFFNEKEDIEPKDIPTGETKIFEPHRHYVYIIKEMKELKLNDNLDIPEGYVLIASNKIDHSVVKWKKKMI